jgi:hypothetical protein
VTANSWLVTPQGIRRLERFDLKTEELFPPNCIPISCASVESEAMSSMIATELRNATFFSSGKLTSKGCRWKGQNCHHLEHGWIAAFVNVYATS